MFIWIKDTFVPSRLHFKNNVMKRYCQTLDLKEDEQLIKEYLAGDTGRNPCGRDLEYGDLPFGNPVVHDRGDAR